MLKAGKLDSDLLKKIVFDKITFRRPEVLTRPGIGEDCAVVDFGSYDCVMSTDPITAAISDIGRLSIHISCNDIASNGIEPLGIMLAVMLPVGTTEEDIEEMMRQAGEVSERLGVEIIGGHTEITPAVNKPVIVSTAIGRAPKSGSQQADQLVPGDYIMITKSAGLEGSGIIACDFEEELKKVLTDEGYLIKITEVVGVKIGDAPGKLSYVLRTLADAGINMEYLYAFMARTEKHAYVVLRVADNEAAEAALTEAGFHLITDADVSKL